MVQTVIKYLLALIFGIIASIVAVTVPVKEELMRLITKPTPTPTITEQVRALTREEAATMSGDFIREFETMMASGTAGGR